MQYIKNNYGKKVINCIFLVFITYLSVYITNFKVEIQTNGYITLNCHLTITLRKFNTIILKSFRNQILKKDSLCM